MTIKTVELQIEGMTCNHCALSIDKLLTADGVLAKKVSYPDKNARITFDSKKVSVEQLRQRVDRTGQYRTTGYREIGNGNGKKPHLVIIGGGSAAFAATIQAHESGARVTMVNDGLPIGGTCVNVGCVPSKNLIRAAEALHRAKQTVFPGIETGGRLADFSKVIEQKRELVQELRQEKYINVVADMDDFTLIEGRARLTAATTVEVNGETLAADAILIATGARPSIPDIPGLADSGYLTNESAFELESLPESLIVLGGRYIALETAQMFARLGSRVTLLQRSERILPTETSDLTEALTGFLRSEGIEIVTGNDIQQVLKDENEVVVRTRVNGTDREFRADKILVATGRRPNTDGLGLEKAGVALTETGAVRVDEHLQTSAPGIFAAGDVLGENMFVYTAAYEGKLAAANALSDTPQSRDYTALPWVIFTDPQVAGVGLDEVQAAERGIEAEAALLELKHVPRALAARDTRGFIKLIRDKNSDRLIGARVLAPEGGELLMEAALAIKFGITVTQLKEMFHPYLTLSEGIKLAAITFSKSVAELSCCAT